MNICNKRIFAPFQFRTHVCPLRVRRFVHWATAARHIDFMLCSVFMSSWQRIIDSAFAFTTHTRTHEVLYILHTVQRPLDLSSVRDFWIRTCNETMRIQAIRERGQGRSMNWALYTLNSHFEYVCPQFLNTNTHVSSCKDFKYNNLRRNILFSTSTFIIAQSSFRELFSTFTVLMLSVSYSISTCRLTLTYRHETASVAKNEGVKIWKK